MTAHFTSDPNQGQGYGIIIVPNIQCSSVPSFAIYRASDGQCLSLHGWQSAEEYIQATQWDCDSGQLRLAVNADIVDQLDILETYRIFIKDETQSFEPQTMLVTDIAYSSMHGGQGVGSVSDSPLSMGMPTLMADPIPEPETEPKQEAQSEIEDMPQTVPLSMDAKDTQEEEPKKSHTVLIVILIALLILSALGIWWYMQNKEALSPESGTNVEENASQTEQANDAKDTENTENTDNSEKLLEPKDQEKTETAEPKSDPAQDAANTPSNAPSAMHQARELLRKNDAGAASWHLVENLQKSPIPEGSQESAAQRQDALFLLVEDAAQKGVSKAMLALGTYYNPADTNPKGSIIPDMNEAYAWYKKAQAAGEAEAEKALGTLRTFVEEAAAKGDTQAQQLLQAWK